MSDAGRAASRPAKTRPAGTPPPPPAAPADRANGAAPATQDRVAELRVSGNLMTLASGLFCIFRQPGGAPINAETGLPGVRLSLPPGRASRPDQVRISTFRDDGWLGDSTGEGAALVRVADGPAHVLVTIYQAPNQPAESAPRLQVLQLSGNTPVADAARAAPIPARATTPDILAHIQRSGDVGGQLGQWVGVPGSKAWIEGFSVSPQGGVAPEDIEYQAVLGRGWLSPWVSDGKFCGSRGMALPLLGLRLRLRGAAAAAYECSVSATFIDGGKAGPAGDGEACESESLAPLEAFAITLRRRDADADPAAAHPASKPALAKPALVKPAPAKAPAKAVRRAR